MAPATPTDGLAAGLRRAALALVMAAAILLVFVDAPWLAAGAAALLGLFLALGWRQFGVGTWVPVLLSLAVLAAALWRGVPGGTFAEAAGRMLFLSALIAVLGTLRAAAALAPEVAAAGLFVTAQPAARRYAALTMGGHVFGVLINFGGLALLLDLAMRSMSDRATQDLPDDLREMRLKRMTLAVVRGFGLIALWSPLGFSINAVLLTLPDLSYLEFGPLGFAMSFVFAGIGWAFDRAEGRRARGRVPARAVPAGAWRGAALLVGHVILLGGAVVALHEVAPLTFQEALIVTVPSYAVAWSAVSGRRTGGGAAAGVAAAARATWSRLSFTAGEIGVFASAGFLPPLLLALVPSGPLRAALAGAGLGAVPLAVGLTGAIVGLACLGVNPIVSASVLGAIAAELAVPGLSHAAIALAITGGWSAVIGLSPFIATITFASAIVGRPVGLIGPVWNGPYCLTILALWCAMLAGLIATGAV